MILTHIHPRLPMRDKSVTKAFYTDKLGFEVFGATEYDDYLMLSKDQIQVHFFRFKGLDPYTNYGQVYIRTDDVEKWYKLALERRLTIPELGHLQVKPWGQKEFSIVDPDHNLLTFGQPFTGK